MENSNITNLAEFFVQALQKDITILKEICAPDCRLWHSSDNKWIEQGPALDAFIVAQKAGDVPNFDTINILTTNSGFVAQTSMTMKPIGVMHIVQVVCVNDGLITSIEEYIAPEMDIAAQLSSA